MSDTRNITFRIHEQHFLLVQRAAKKKGINVSDYVRDHIVPQAGRDTGETPAALPKLERGRYGGVVAQAARMAGLTPEAFKKQAAENLATALLEQAAKNPKAGSGERPSAKLRAAGRYSETPTARGKR